MHMELFQKIVDDLAAMARRHGRKLQTLNLYKDGEPLLNDMLASMIGYAKAGEVADRVSTTTNGILLNANRVVQLIDAGLDYIRISVPLDDNYWIVKRHCAFLYHEKTARKAPLFVHVKAIGNLMSSREQRRFREDFASISDFLNLDNLMGWSGTQGGDFLLGHSVTRGMDGRTKLRARKICPEPFCRLAINFNGSVSACCVDWAMDKSYGNAEAANVEEIWNGEELDRLRALHARGDRDANPICKGCHYIMGLPPTMHLDHYAASVVRMYGWA